MHADTGGLTLEGCLLSGHILLELQMHIRLFKNQINGISPLANGMHTPVCHCELQNWGMRNVPATGTTLRAFSQKVVALGSIFCTTGSRAAGMFGVSKSALMRIFLNFTAPQPGSIGEFSDEDRVRGWGS
jgi:hypothetical protein